MITINATYKDYPTATKIVKIKNPTNHIKISDIAPQEDKREGREKEIFVPLKKDTSSPLATLMYPFYNILTLIFGDHEHVLLFLHYLAELLFFNINENNSINPNAYLIILNDNYRIVERLIKLLVPNFDTLGYASQIIMYEKESWKKNVHLENIMTNPRISEALNITLYSSKNAIITNRDIQNLRILRVHPGLYKLKNNMDDEYASMLIWLIIDTINDPKTKITKGIKKDTKKSLIAYLDILSA